jgi:glutaminyl-tRNA synthetase
MKQDIENPNPQMWDLFAWRIPEGGKQHHRAPTYKMFPTYDMAHGRSYWSLFLCLMISY